MSFEDLYNIHHYEDDEVSEVISQLLEDQDLFALVSTLKPGLQKYLPSFISTKLSKNFLTTIFRDSDSIESFQNSLAPIVEEMIKRTTSEFTISGIENLNSIPALYISNHRDIALDSLFLNIARYRQGLSTVRIAIGDNLLNGKFSEKIMRLNKSFIVHREIKGVKETLKKLMNLSAYVNKSLIEDRESIWIAQLEGRANDGNDITDPAVLKMLHLSQRKEKDLNNWLNEVNLTPITISYEFDPLDVTKAIGWEGWRDLSLEENNKRDIKELINGLIGNKGRVNLHIGEPIMNSDSYEELARAIDKSMHENFKIYPSAEISDQLLEGKTANELGDAFNKEYLHNFITRFKSLDEELKVKVFAMYAAPLINKKRGQSGD